MVDQEAPVLSVAAANLFMGQPGATERLTHVDSPSPFVTTTLVLLVVAPLGGIAASRLGRER